MVEVFSDENTIQAMLDVEAALARAEAKTGIIPENAANTDNRHLCAIMKEGSHGQLLDAAAWDSLFDPITYTGRAGNKIDAVLNRYNKRN